MTKFSEFWKRRSFQSRIFLPYFLLTVLIATLIILWNSNVLKQNVEYRLVDTLHHNQNIIATEIESLEENLRFYGHFMADVYRISDQSTNPKIGRSILAYGINFLRSQNMYPHVHDISYPKDEPYAALIQKGFMGLNSTSLIEHTDDGKLTLSIDSITPIETQGGVKQTVIISYPLNQKFLNNLRAHTGADISIIHNNQIILSSIKTSSFIGDSVDKIKELPLEIMIKQNKSYLTRWETGEGSHKVFIFPLTINYKNAGLLAVSLPLKEVFLIQRNIYTYAGSLALVVLAITGIMYIFISRRLTYPIAQLSVAAERLADGDPAQKVKVTSTDEVGSLQKFFNIMVENLAEAENMQRMTKTLQRSQKEMMEWNKILEHKVAKRAAKLREVQQQLTQAEKFSALGELVSGVAHEINNPLTAIIGFAQLLLPNTEDEAARKSLEKIVHEAIRVSKIVKNLLTFARKEEPCKRFAVVNDVVIRVIELKAYELAVNNIEVVQNLDPSLKATMVDPNQIEQVVLNILNNAEQAINENGRHGRINISSSQREDRIIIKISDNGPGIPQENRSKVFDPFYTTKEVGQGTGLGLSVSYGIIKEHGGSIRLETKVGRGSTFTISLPLVAEVVVLNNESEPEVDEDILSGKRVLVIDDEVEVLNCISDFLESSDSIVEIACNGSEGLKKLRKNHYDVVVCDVKMPVMDGKTLYNYICFEMPEMAERIVFSTGDLVGKETRKFIESTKVKYVNKPFDFPTLKRAMGDIITQAGRNQALFL